MYIGLGTIVLIIVLFLILRQHAFALRRPVQATLRLPAVVLAIQQGRQSDFDQDDIYRTFKSTPWK